MAMCDKFNGGFLRPAIIKNPVISLSGIESDENTVFSIYEDSTSVNKLKPVLLSNDATSDLVDEMIVEVFYDHTTNYLVGKPAFIEGTADDFHQLPDLEYGEGISALAYSDRYVRTPHFIVKPDSTSQYLGKDRFDNFMTDPLDTFGGKFDWFTNELTNRTFNGGDLYSTEENLHLAFMYLKVNNDSYLKTFMADLYYSKYSKNDGTFQEPVIVDRDINVIGMNSAFSTTWTNMKVNPRFLNVDGLGLILNTFRKDFSLAKDTSQYYINMKLSRDDGNTWRDFKNIHLNMITSEKFNQRNLPLDEMVSPQMYWEYAENKIVGLINFKTPYDGNSLTSQLTTRANIIVSYDLCKSFKQINVDFSKIIGNIKAFTATGSGPVIVDDVCMFYDKKNSKFFICSILSQESTGPTTATGLAILANFDDKLDKWDLVYTENLSGSSKMFSSGNTKTFKIGVRSFRDNLENVLDGHGPKMIPFVNKEGVSNIVINGGMMYRPSNYVGVFDQYADYTGMGGLLDEKYFWLNNPLIMPLELIPSSDSYLNRFKQANSPWRARKITQTSNIGHRNSIGSTGVAPNEGSAINLLMDGIIYQNSEKNYDLSSVIFRHPRNRFHILSYTEFNDNIFMLGSDFVMGSTSNNVAIEYQIPFIMHRENWSNLNIKPRKTYYLTPMRHYDSTFNGWTATSSAAGQEVITEYRRSGLTSPKKNWEVKFARSDTAQGASTVCGLEHLTGTTAFQGNRGAMWDADSTRGAFAHFICSLDSAFYRDVTSMVHFMSIPSDAGGTSNKTVLQTFLGKDHIAFRSSGSAETNKYETFSADTTRDMEFLVVVNRFRSIDTTQEHRGFFRYKGSRDWTFMYFNLCATGTGFSAFAGIRLGNLWRWPSSIAAADATNVVYFKYHAEGWSAFGMHWLYPSTVSGSLSPSQDNKMAVNPLNCSPVSNYLPGNFKIAWAGQDSTCNAVFRIKKDKTKYTFSNVFIDRPTQMWKSTNDITNQYSIIIDLGETHDFNSIAFYDHNLVAFRAYYGQENNSTDWTSFLYVGTASISRYFDDGLFYNNEFRNKNNDAFTFDSDNITVVDTNTIICRAKTDESSKYSTLFDKILKYGEDVIGRKIMFLSPLVDAFVTKKCNSIKFLSSTECQLTFEDPEGPTFGIPLYFDVAYENGELLSIINDRSFYVLRNRIKARYIKIVSESKPRDPSSGILVFEEYLYLKNLSIGIFEESENPIENELNISKISTLRNESKISGIPIQVKINENFERLRFELSIRASYKELTEQFGQILSIINDSEIDNKTFYFCPYEMKKIDPTYYAELYGATKYTKFIYLVRIIGKPSIQTDNNLASVNLTLEEVI